MINNKNTEVVHMQKNSSNNKYNFKGSSNFLNIINIYLHIILILTYNSNIYK